MKLIVGTDSTWSLRVWICAKLAGIKVEQKVIDLSAKDYKQQLLAHSPTGLVPALIIDDVVINDSLAIVEYFNELEAGALYPQESIERAVARSLSCEMHSGFGALRTLCPFTLDKVAPLNDSSEEIKSELQRVEQIFSQAELPFMFTGAGAVDAFYAILAFRLQNYGVELSGKAGQYQQSLLNWPLLAQAIQQARQWRER